MPKSLVKARSRQGTNTLDLTIPIKIINEFKIEQGDIFSVFAYKENKNTILKYVRVLKQKDI